MQSSCSASGEQSPISLEASTPPMPNMLPTPEAIALLERYFSDAMEKKHLHSFYTCCGKCSDTSEPEASQINVLCPQYRAHPWPRAAPSTLSRT